jgi:hypothetical protein
MKHAPRFATLAVFGIFCALVIAAGTAPALSFSASHTSSVTANGKAGLEACRSQAQDQRRECVANALDTVANQLRRRPDYIDARDTFRSTASTVRSSATNTTAASAVQAAKSQLLRATGHAAPHHAELAQVMDTARSVLRS